MDSSPISKHEPEAWAEQIAASLRAERESVHEFLASQEQRLEEAENALQELLERFEHEVELAISVPRQAEPNPDDDYERRYELALDDLRELKSANALLQEQLDRARSNASTLAKQTRSESPHLDWEAEKLRILAALESDLNDNEPEQQAERIKIEEVIAATEKALAEKDREIQSLKKKLEESSTGAGAVAMAAAALTEALDHDTAVMDERKRLKAMQDEMQDKLRKAEVDISLERAKLARERAELEERMRTMEASMPKATSSPDAVDESGKPVRGRWMSRLGLTDADRERGRKS